MFDFRHFRNMVITAMIIIFLLFSYVAIGEATSERYIEVDQDIWSFLKYVGVLFLGLLVWAAKDMVTQLKVLGAQFGELNTSVSKNTDNITDIKDEVKEISRKIEAHDTRIFQLERNQRN